MFHFNSTRSEVYPYFPPSFAGKLLPSLYDFTWVCNFLREVRSIHIHPCFPHECNKEFLTIMMENLWFLWQKPEGHLRWCRKKQLRIIMQKYCHFTNKWHSTIYRINILVADLNNNFLLTKFLSKISILILKFSETSSR